MPQEEEAVHLLSRSLITDALPTRLKKTEWLKPLNQVMKQFLHLSMQV